MTISDCLVILAILSAPSIAIQIQKGLERKREEKSRKMNIFRTLMTTRANPMNPQHVEALNTIDIEFYNDKEVVDAWKLLLDSYLDFPKEPTEPNYKSKLDSCVKKSNDLLTDLLFNIAKSLDYSFDKVELKRDAYFPKGHTDLLIDQEIIRRGVAGVLLGQVPIPIRITNPLPSTEEKKEVKEEGK